MTNQTARNIAKDILRTGGINDDNRRVKVPVVRNTALYAGIALAAVVLLATIAFAQDFFVVAALAAAGITTVAQKLNSVNHVVAREQVKIDCFEKQQAVPIKAEALRRELKLASVEQINNDLLHKLAGE
ncbi:hypothetical protein [Quatrionicoccus australiensis]|uniref:hypothetical protein n=1 Tax=Quatrionicoccus australiensis TaxID=138118 RepID=UPI001CF9AD0F|nr:hypothetical protein [Quatrionicoccus australiensis]MCB4359585.1 hypothetical protein [Quatrionicoccus australiensis]